MDGILQWAIIAPALASMQVPVYAETGKIVPPDARTSNRPIAVSVAIPQTALLVREDRNEAPSPNPYGLIGALLLDVGRTAEGRQANIQLDVLVRALGPFDAGKPLLSGINSGILNVDWITLSSAKSAPSSVSVNDQSNYRAEVTCSYTMGLVFQSLYVRCDISMLAPANGRLAKSGGLFEPAKVQKTVEFETTLDMKSYLPGFKACARKEHRDLCRDIWARNDASLLRRELSSSLTDIGKFVIRAIRLDKDDAALLRSKATPSIYLMPDVGWGLKAHVGKALEGADNVVDPGAPPGIAVAKPAVINPDSSGVVILTASGDLYGRRIISVPIQP
jgi:hypothetical protein